MTKQEAINAKLAEPIKVDELGEHATDADVISTFLTLNFTGTPMSKEHIEYIQSIKL
jgi:hypothetical protein